MVCSRYFGGGNLAAIHLVAITRFSPVNILRKNP